MVRDEVLRLADELGELADPSIAARQLDTSCQRCGSLSKPNTAGGCSVAMELLDQIDSMRIKSM